MVLWGVNLKALSKDWCDLQKSLDILLIAGYLIRQHGHKYPGLLHPGSMQTAWTQPNPFLHYITPTFIISLAVDSVKSPPSSEPVISWHLLSLSLLFPTCLASLNWRHQIGEQVSLFVLHLHPSFFLPTNKAMMNGTQRCLSTEHSSQRKETTKKLWNRAIESFHFQWKRGTIEELILSNS